MRINKYISSTGFCSRREADKLVEAGRVTINGEIAVMGSTAEENDLVCIDGKAVEEKKPCIYIALNKPVGITCTTERHIEGNIVDFINHPERIFHIGRLDKDSQGLILMTNDGDIVNKILRAENNHEKEYIVTVERNVTEEFINGMKNGVPLDGTMTKPCEVHKKDDKVFSIILTEGRFRQIRRMCSYFGYSVKKLKRIRIMNIKLDALQIGEWRYLTEDELKELFGLLSYYPN